MEFYEGHIPVGDAVMLEWTSLRDVPRSWGFENREREGFPATLPGNHISA